MLMVTGRLVNVNNKCYICCIMHTIEEQRLLMALHIIQYGALVCNKCGRRVRPIRTRRLLGCSLGHHMHPLAGTIFEKSTQPLKNWLLAIAWIQLDTTMPAKELERRLDITYKTAWRMKTLIMAELGIPKSRSTKTMI